MNKKQFEQIYEETETPYDEEIKRLIHIISVQETQLTTLRHQLDHFKELADRARIRIARDKVLNENEKLLHKLSKK